MKGARVLSYRRKSLKGGMISNIKKLEKDFAEQVSFGKSDQQASGMSASAIKKKFSI